MSNYHILTEPIIVVDVEIQRELTWFELEWLEEHSLATSSDCDDFWMNIDAVVYRDDVPPLIKEILDKVRPDYDYVRIN